LETVKEDKNGFVGHRYAIKRLRLEATGNYRKYKNEEADFTIFSILNALEIIRVNIPNKIRWSTVTALWRTWLSLECAEAESQVLISVHSI